MLPRGEAPNAPKISPEKEKLLPPIEISKYKWRQGSDAQEHFWRVRIKELFENIALEK